MIMVRSSCISCWLISLCWLQMNGTLNSVIKWLFWSWYKCCVNYYLRKGSRSRKTKSLKRQEDFFRNKEYWFVNVISLALYAIKYRTISSQINNRFKAIDKWFCRWMRECNSLSIRVTSSFRKYGTKQQLD